MKNRTLLVLLLTIVFVGATSCGDDSANHNLAAENAALRAALAQRAAQGPSSVNVTVTQIATAVANITVTSASSSTDTSSNGVTVVYTVTSSSTGTAVRQ